MCDCVQPIKNRNGINAVEGIRDFQIDLASDLMKYSIGLEWDGKSKARLSFMPKVLWCFVIATNVSFL